MRVRFLTGAPYHRRAPVSFALAGVLASVCAASTPGLAQDPPAEDPPAAEAPAAVGSFTLEDIDVTDTRNAEDAEPTLGTQIITREEILATSNDNVAEVLDQVPGLYVRQNEQFRLGASTVRMQGADPNKVAILLNGRRFRGGIDGVVDLRDIPVDNIEKIEIVRGPATSLYGSDAMVGVINIVTRTATETPSFNAVAGGGNLGRMLFSASHGYQIGPVGYFLSYQHDEIEIAQQFGEISQQFALDSDAKQRRDDIFGTVDYQVTDEHKVAFTGDYNPVEEGPDSHRENLTLGLDWNAQWTPLTAMDTGVGRYGFSRKNDLPGFNEDVTYADWTADMLAMHTLLEGFIGEQHALNAGLRTRFQQFESAAFTTGQDSATPFTVPGVDKTLWQVSPFLQDEIVLGRHWAAVIGTSFDVNQGFGLSVNPRASVSYRPWDGYRVTGTVGRGFRAPDLLQLYDVDANNIFVVRDRLTGYIILGNPDLQPEKSLGFNLEFQGRPYGGVNVFLNLFRNNFDDLIDLTIACVGPTMCVPGYTNPFPQLFGQIFLYENVGKAVTQGVEFSLNLEPFLIAGLDTGAHQVLIDLSYGFLDTENQSNRPGENGKELPFSPRNRFLPGVTYRNNDWGSEAKVYAEYEDAYFTDLTNSEDFETKNHWLWNFRVSQRLSTVIPLNEDLPGVGSIYDGLSLFAEGNNVFNQEFGFFTPMGRIAGEATFLFGVAYGYRG